MNSTFSAVVSVGPGPKELSRLNDLVISLGSFDKEHLHELLIVDDSAGENGYADVISGATIPIRVVTSPRKGRGDVWRGGLAANVLFGLKAAFSSPAPVFVLKLDTDSLAIGPVAERIIHRFDQDTGVGVLGSCFLTTLQGTLREPSTWGVNLNKWRRRIRLRRNPFPHIETAFHGRNKMIRFLTRRAVANGWPLGSCAQGGGYAVRRELFDRLQAAQYLNDDLLWLHTDLGEDVVTGLLCYAAGMKVADDNGRGGVFGVQYIGLGFGVEELFDRGYGIVHSVKEQEWLCERQLRSDFLNRISHRASLSESLRKPSAGSMSLMRCVLQPESTEAVPRS